MKTDTIKIRDAGSDSNSAAKPAPGETVATPSNADASREPAVRAKKEKTILDLRKAQSKLPTGTFDELIAIDQCKAVMNGSRRTVEDDFEPVRYDGNKNWKTEPSELTQASIASPTARAIFSSGRRGPRVSQQSRQAPSSR